MNKNNIIKSLIIKKKVPNKKYALLIGISDYYLINDLEYCDDDIQAWCNDIKNKNYDITVLGDGNTLNSNNCIYYKDLALESNVKKHLDIIYNKIKSNDTLYICTSGHGNGDGKGNSFICLLDQKINNDSNNIFNNDGSLYDKELSLIIKKFINKNVKVILFFDNCFSGGMLDEINTIYNTSKNKNICATSTCTFEGYGFDNSTYKQGQWTYFFLNTLINKQYSNKSIYNIYVKAKNEYILKCKLENINKPQFVGNKNLFF